MSDFVVKIDPPIAQTANHVCPTEPDWNLVFRAQEEGQIGDINLSYVVGGLEFGSYPSDLMGVLSDLLAELEKITRGEKHLVEVGGYPILSADISDGITTFYDAVTEKPVADVDSVVVLSELQRAADLIWSFVLHRARS